MFLLAEKVLQLWMERQIYREKVLFEINLLIGGQR